MTGLRLLTASQTKDRLALFTDEQNSVPQVRERSESLEPAAIIVKDDDRPTPCPLSQAAAVTH